MKRVPFFTAMRRADAPMELHIYAKGPHGDGMSPTLGPISEWPRLCELWMRWNGWLALCVPDTGWLRRQRATEERT